MNLNESKPIILNNTKDSEEAIKFDSDLVNLYIDSCATEGLTGFRCDFIKDSYIEIPIRSTDTTTGKISIIDKEIAAYRFIDDKGEPFMLYTKISCAP